MRSNLELRGIEPDQEQRHKELLRDVRPLWRQILDTLRDRSIVSSLLCAMAGIAIFYPVSANLCCVAGLLLYSSRQRAARRERLPFRLPATAEGIDYSDPVPGRRKHFKSEGIFFVGNEWRTGRELWLKAKDVLTHMLIFGTTGSGKTETLVSLAFNAIAMGSGCIYIDPKAAPKLPMQIYQMARLCGRDDDIKVLNFGTSGKKGSGPQPVRLSNTHNAFAFGSAEMLTQLLVSLLPPSEGPNAIFSQNAQTLITALMYALVELRDRGEIALSIESIRDHMVLSEYVKLATRPDLSDTTRGALKNFLSSVGWQEHSNQQPKSLAEQYGYARAYFGLSLATLTDTYGHIFKTSMGEIDLYDVITSRRIMVVLLPSLEKAPPELANLGKICLSGVRNATSVGLGSRIVGTVEDVLGSLPVDSPTPFLSITDEYAAIPTPGYAEVLTQGRGLGVAAIVASQDWVGIEESDKKGAGQIKANTKVKGLMKCEDVTTYKIFDEMAGQASILQTSGMHVDTRQTMSTGYTDKLEVQIQQRSRLDFLDATKQIEGEIHLIFNGDVVRARTFYANPPLPKNAQLRIGEMLRIQSPDPRRLASRQEDVQKLIAKLRESIQKKRPLQIDMDDVPEAMLRQIKLLADAFGAPCSARPETAICAFLNWREGHRYSISAWRDGRRQRLEATAQGASVDASAPLQASPAPSPAPEATVIPGPDRVFQTASTVQATPEVPEAPTSSDAFDLTMFAPPLIENEDADESVGGQRASATRVKADNPFAQGFADHQKWLLSPEPPESESEVHEDLIDNRLREDLARTEELLGATPDQAREAAQTTIESLASAVEEVSYPEQPVPTKTEGLEDELDAALQAILSNARRK